MTAQFSDTLIHNGQELSLYGEPLGAYLRQLPEERRPDFWDLCSACWRGYTATWEIVDQRLYLTKVSGTLAPNAEGVEDPLAFIFPDQVAPIPASWVTGKLRCPEGKMVGYAHSGFDSVFERDRIFTVNRGVVEEEVVVDGRIGAGRF